LAQRKRGPWSAQPGEDAQLGAERRRGAAEDVEAPAGLPAAVGGTRPARAAGRRRRPAVVERGGGDVADPPARRAPAALPLLLVAVELAALVERSGARDRAAADRHVGAPRAIRVGVGRPEVHGGHGRPSRPQARRRMVLEAGMDGAGEDADLVAHASAAASSASSQPGRTATSSSTNTSELRVGGDIAVLRAALRPRAASWPGSARRAGRPRARRARRARRRPR
jgi:hypothetical protein